MALLNYATGLSFLKNLNQDYYNVDTGEINFSSWSDSDKIKLILTGDKHIITHGVDLLADYVVGGRGLVPKYNATGDYAVFGKNGWTQLDINYLPFSKSINKSDSTSYVDTLIPTNKAVVTYVENYVGEFVKAAETMRFMGVISVEGINYSYVKVGESESQSGFPTECQIGDTYRVRTNGNYAGVLCEAGDMLICIKDGSGDSLNSSDYWTVIQTNINASSNITLNGSANPLKVYSNGGADLSFYAPSNAGTSGNILVSTGATPEWKNPNEITVGKATTAESLKDKPVITAADNKIAITVGGQTSESVTIPFATKAESAGSADKVIGKLSVSSGLKINSEYDGSKDSVISLLAATTDQLGGVKVDTTYLTLVDGKLSIDADKFASALGKLDALTSVLSAESITGGALLKLTSGNTENIIPIIGGNGITTSYTNNAINVTLLLASDATLGGIKTGYNTNNEARKYAVALDENGKAYVHVNWTNENNAYVSSAEASGENLTLNASINSGKLTINGKVNVAGKDQLGVVKSGSEITKTDGLYASPIINGVVYHSDTTYSFENGTNVNTFKVTPINGTTQEITIDPYIANNVTYKGTLTNGYVATFDGTNGQIKATHIDSLVKNTDTWRSIKIGTEELLLNNDNTALTFLAGDNITLAKGNNSGELKISAVDTKYSAGRGITLDANNVFNLNTADANGIGGIQLGYNTNNEARKYAVQLDDNKAYVEVPWTDPNWRDIKINGTSIGDKALNIIPSSDVVMEFDDGSADGEATISFKLGWMNLSTGNYEYAG